MRKVAVTGSIASGKTTVCHLFQELGAYVTSADAVVHELLNPSTDLGKQIVSLLGPDVVVGGVLDREVIAQKVFRDHHLLKQLERHIHPEVRKELEKHFNRASQEHYPLFVAEIPLLFEGGLEHEYDAVIVVDGDEKQCRERFLFDSEDYERRKQRLMPIEEKKKRADWVIENRGSIEELKQSVMRLFNSLKGDL